MLKNRRRTLAVEEPVACFSAYLLVWISGLIVLFVERQQPNVRYHAAQSVVIFGALGLLGLLVPLLPVVGFYLQALLAVLAFGLWIVLMLTSLLASAPRLPVVMGPAQKLERYAQQLAGQLSPDGR